jgi:hypothetical protein
VGVAFASSARWLASGTASCGDRGLIRCRSAHRSSVLDSGPCSATAEMRLSDRGPALRAHHPWHDHLCRHGPTWSAAGSRTAALPPVLATRAVCACPRRRGDRSPLRRARRDQKEPARSSSRPSWSRPRR